MNFRRGSTLSPISTVKSPSVSMPSSIVHLEHRTLLRVHRRFPELFGIHLTKTFVSLDRKIFLRK
jgi:hypothetical protein